MAVGRAGVGPPAPPCRAAGLGAALPSPGSRPASNIQPLLHSEPSDRTRQRPHEGSVIHGAPGRVPKNLLCLLLQRSGEKGGEKFPEQTWATCLFCPTMLSTCWMPGPWTEGCCQGLGRSVSLYGPPTFPQETMREEAAAPDQVTGRKESLDPLPSLGSSFPFSSFLPAASSWLHPFSSSIPPTLPCSPWLFTGGSLLPARSRC